MARANYCEFFRFNDQYCDVFEEEPGLYLYAVAEAWDGRGDFLTCKEYAPAANGGWIVSSYSGADAEYLASLEPAPENIARAIIASEERYTLECMAGDYGYTRKYVVDAYREQIEAGEDPHEAFMFVGYCMMERDL